MSLHEEDKLHAEEAAELAETTEEPESEELHKEELEKVYAGVALPD